LFSNRFGWTRYLCHFGRSSKEKELVCFDFNLKAESTATERLTQVLRLLVLVWALA
jgi:hypothetical protein